MYDYANVGYLVPTDLCNRSSLFCRCRYCSHCSAVSGFAPRSESITAGHAYQSGQHARGGSFICLFVLLAISRAFEDFHKNILVALGASPIILAVFLWGLWRYSSLQRVNRYLMGETDEPHWELRMSVAFCSLLLIIVASALLLTMRGIHLK